MLRVNTLYVDKEGTGTQKFDLHFLVMKHKNPEVFLPEKQNEGNLNNNKIFLKDYLAEHQYLTIFNCKCTHTWFV